jgi:CheY-like chemotaxis protein
MKRRILLVDDELAILLTLRAILEMSGFEVDTAASAKEAQNKLKSGVYEMVITDMRMETETSGYDVIRAARQQPYDPATALLTAYPSLGNEWKSTGEPSPCWSSRSTPTSCYASWRRCWSRTRTTRCSRTKSGAKKNAAIPESRQARNGRPRAKRAE